jgi:hypothetical protein
MTSTTTNLGLFLYDDDLDRQKTFLEYRQAQNAPTNSNMTKIDTAIGDLQDDVAALDAKTSGVFVLPENIANRTRKFLVMPDYTYLGDVFGTHATRTSSWGYMTSTTQTTRFFGAFQVPEDYVSDLKVSIVLGNHAETAQQVVFDHGVNFCAPGDTGTEIAITINDAIVVLPPVDKYLALPITLVGAKKSDAVFVHAYRIGGHADDVSTEAFTCFEGFLVEYTADS